MPWARIAVLTLSLGLPVVELLNLFMVDAPATVIGVVAVGVALVLPLHLRHVVAGLRGEPPTHPGPTIAAMAVVLAVVTPFGGSQTALLLACLACSILLTVPAPWSLLGLAACAGWAALLGGDDVIPDLARGGPYLALAVVYRSVSVFLVIWFVAARTRLDANRGDAAEAAVAAERASAASEVLFSARAAIAGFPAAADQVVARLAAGETDAATSRLRSLVDAARAALADVRRALRARTGDTLQAAGALLDAVPARNHEPTPPGVFPPDPGPGGIAFERFLGRVHHRRWLVVAGLLPVAVFAFLQSTALLPGLVAPDADPVLAGVCVVADLALLLRLGFLRVAGVRARERHLLVAAVGLLALVPLPFLGIQWAWGQMLVPPAVMLAYGPRVGLGAIAVAALWLTVGYDWLLGAFDEWMVSGAVPVLAAAAVGTGYWFLVVGLASATAYGSAELTRTASDLVDSRRALAVRARDDERLRLARDLHDVLGHRLSALSLVGDLVGKLIPRDIEAARVHAAELTALATALDREVDAVLRGDEAPRLASESSAARTLLRTAGVVAHVSVDVPHLPPEQDEVLGWAVREGVTNILRHSDARHCTLNADVAADGIRLELSNDGVRSASGTDPGAGLRGLEQRIRALGGEMVAGVDQRTAERFVLTVSVPALVPAA